MLSISGDGKLRIESGDGAEKKSDHIDNCLNFAKIVTRILSEIDNTSNRRFQKCTDINDGIEIIDGGPCLPCNMPRLPRFEGVIDMNEMEGVEIPVSHSVLWAWALMVTEVQKPSVVEYLNVEGSLLNNMIKIFYQHKLGLDEGTKVTDRINRLRPELKSVKIIATPVRRHIKDDKYHDHVVMSIIPSITYDDKFVEERNGKFILKGEITPVTPDELSQAINVPADLLSELFRVRDRVLYEDDKSSLVLNLDRDRPVGWFDTLVDLDELTICGEVWYAFSYTQTEAGTATRIGINTFIVEMIEKDLLPFKVFELFSKASSKYRLG